jgi:DnaJ domain
MSINPLIPYIPAFLSFFIYGYLSGFLFLLWKRSRWGCLLTIGFWYLYAVWCIWFGMLVSVQDLTNQTWFVLGVALSFLRPLLQSVAVQNFIEDITHAGHLGRRAWQAVTGKTKKKDENEGRHSRNQTNQQSQQTHYGYSQGNDQNEQARRAEQARREAEARARRSEKEKENQQSRADDPKPEPSTADTRTPEEILGLGRNWTQADLKAIYKSESQRTHPDKWIGKPPAVRHAMEEEYKNIQQAYHKLKT